MELNPVKLKQLLLVEPQSMFRHTLAAVARQLKVADVVEASSYEAAQSLLETQRFDGLLLAVGDGVASLNLLQTLRMGKTRNTRVLPLALMAEAMDPITIEVFRTMSPQRILLVPFKVKTALEVVTGLVAEPPKL